jgi:CelD/BcsL family acetyltransferase involved in cellulose biosynthesis
MDDEVKIATFDCFGDELEAYWKRLEPVSEHHVFQTYDWLRFWQETVGSAVLQTKPWIAVVLDDSDEPRIIFPLGIRRIGRIRVLEFLGTSQGDYLGPLIHKDWQRDSRAIEAAWSLVTNELPKHAVRHFVKLPALWVEDQNPLLDILKTNVQDSSYSARLPSTWQEFQSRLRTKLKADNKRQRRRLGERGNLRFEVLKKGTELTAHIEIMIKQKRERYRATGVPNIFEHSEVGRFYRDLPAIAVGGRCIHFSVLKLDDEVLAAHWGAIYRGRFYYLMPSYAGGDWQNYSPGRLLLESLLEWCIAAKLELFDFTIGGEDYKKDWCEREMRYFEHIKVVTPLGLPYLIYIRLRRWVRRNPRLWSLVRRIYARSKYGTSIEQ